MTRKVISDLPLKAGFSIAFFLHLNVLKTSDVLEMHFEEALLSINVDQPKSIEDPPFLSLQYCRKDRNDFLFTQSLELGQTNSSLIAITYNAASKQLFAVAESSDGRNHRFYENVDLFRQDRAIVQMVIGQLTSRPFYRIDEQSNRPRLQEDSTVACLSIFDFPLNQEDLVPINNRCDYSADSFKFCKTSVENHKLALLKSSSSPRPIQSIVSKTIVIIVYYFY